MSTIMVAPSLDIFNKLLEAGINPTRRLDIRATALQIAASGLETDLVDLLLENNANSRIEDSLGRTPFDITKEKFSFLGAQTLFRLNDLRFQ